MPPATTARDSATVLIVCEDDNACASLLRGFESASYRVVSASDASSALRLLQQTPADLVLLDLSMTQLDGLALCRLLRSQPGITKVPIIALSNPTVAGQEAEALAAGADDSINNGSSVEEIVSRSATY